MSQEIYKKLVSFRKKEVRKMRKLHDTPRYRETIEMYVEPVATYLDTGQLIEGPIANNLDYPILGMWANAAFAQSDEDAEALKLAQARYIGFSYIAWKLKFDTMKAGLIPKAIISHPKVANLSMQLFSIGWEKEAIEVITQFWSHLPDCTANTSDGSVELPPPHMMFAWFGSYFALGSRDLITQWDADEPREPDTAHSHLLGRWNEPDGAALTNLMTAYSEQNVVRMLLPDSQRTPDFDPYLIPYCAYDLTAIQMRRKMAGLELIPMDDARLSDHYFDGEEAPLVQDDLIWPTYLKACEAAGLTPYAPRKTVQAKTDRTTLAIA